MTDLDEEAPEALDRVLILAPYRRDAEYLSRLLTEHDILAEECADPNDLATRLAASPGVFVTTHEALSRATIAAVADHLHAQPTWSELPIVVLLDRASPNNRVRAELGSAWPRSRQLFYQRPLTPVELISGIQSALLARVRQRDVRDHIEREIELRRELNHRVKNILASVSSIFQMTRRGAATIEQVTEDFTSRLEALSKVHSAVFRADGETISVAEIVDLTFNPYRVTGQSRIVTEGPSVTLTRAAGTTLALCLHELTTNAIKYGALSRAEGNVTFRWEVTHDVEPELSISWIESGGPPVVEPSRAGYGTRYLRSALASLFGRKPDVIFAESGLRCDARGPLARVSCNPAP